MSLPLRHLGVATAAALMIAGAAAGGLASVLEEKTLWARYGL